jgi:hypothetical protein
VNSRGAKALFEEALAPFDERLLAARGWTIHERTFPILDISFRAQERKELRLRLACDDWNDEPPAVALLAPDGKPLAVLPPPRPNSIFNAGPHSQKGGPFICVIGTREYHTHGNHVSDHWSNYRAHQDYTLGGLIDQFWRGWRSFWP